MYTLIVDANLNIQMKVLLQDFLDLDFFDHVITRCMGMVFSLTICVVASGTIIILRKKYRWTFQQRVGGSRWR
jgi:hypothetical protein